MVCPECGSEQIIEVSGTHLTVIVCPECSWYEEFATGPGPEVGTTIRRRGPAEGGGAIRIPEA